MGYFKTVAKGVSWYSLIRVVAQVLGFTRVFVLARLLTPVQFGVFGVAILVLSFIEVLTETGVNIFLIQEDRQKFDEYLNSAWVVSIVRGTIIALFLLITAPWISSFFHSPESLLLLQLIAVVPFIKGFINPSLVLLQKEYCFRKEAAIRSSVLALGTLVSIMVAYITRSAISLVIGMILEALAEVVLTWILITPRPRFEFHSARFTHLFHQGKWVTLSATFYYLFHQLDNIVVGRILGQGALGLYQMGYRISMVPITEIADVFSKVTFPVFTAITGDRSRLRAAFWKVTLTIFSLSLAFGALIFLFPYQIVHIMLGDQWLAVAEFLPILAVFGVIRATSGSTLALFYAAKRQRAVVMVTLASVTGMAVAIVPLVNTLGLVGASYSALLGSLCALPFVTFFTWQILYKRPTA